MTKAFSEFSHEKNVLTDFKNCRIYERNDMYINKIKAVKVVNLNYRDHQRQQ